MFSLINNMCLMSGIRFQCNPTLLTAVEQPHTTVMLELPQIAAETIAVKQSSGFPANLFSTTLPASKSAICHKKMTLWRLSHISMTTKYVLIEKQILTLLYSSRESSLVFNRNIIYIFIQRSIWSKRQYLDLLFLYWKGNGTKSILQYQGRDLQSFAILP